MNKIILFLKSIFCKKEKPKTPTSTKKSVDWSYFFEKASDMTRIKNSVNREAILDIYEGFKEAGDGDLRTFAYGLATCRIETGYRMLPVREGFAKTDEDAIAHVRKYNRKYGVMKNGHVYYGRGYVQLTWDFNYEKEGILHNPDKALETKFAAALLFRGLLDGRWNGKAKGLKYYLDNGKYAEARRTVNVLNKAEVVAQYYKDFNSCLRWV